MPIKAESPVQKKFEPKVLSIDIECAGVQSLKADRGFVVVFGYKWVGKGPAKAITLLDYPGKDIHDDTNLLKAALSIMEEADLVTGHFAEYFDRPYLESRLLRAGLNPLPPTRLVDTCLVAQRRLKLSSNRLGNLAEFLKVKTGKMDKRGGWPDWWMGALRGDRKSIESLAAYCKIDVECQSQCYEAMKPIIPERYLINAAMFNNHPSCPSCGGLVQYRGFRFSMSRMFRRFQCKECGKWGNEKKSVPILK